MTELFIVMAVTCAVVLVGSLIYHFLFRIDAGEIDEGLNSANPPIFRTLTFAKKKLYWYYKPCKWLWITLNIWIPGYVFFCLWGAIQAILNWNDINPIQFIVQLIVVVILVICNLLVRFLDKLGFWLLVISHSTIFIMCLVPLMINCFQGLDAVMAFLLPIIFIIVCYVANLVYLFHRKDLFYSSVKQLRAAYNSNN